MKRNILLDNTIISLENPFTLDQLLSELNSNTEWKKDNDTATKYIENLIKHNYIKLQTNNSYYCQQKFYDEETPISNEVYLKYDIPLGITSKLNDLIIKHGLEISSIKQNLVNLSMKNCQIIDNEIKHNDSYRFFFDEIVYKNYLDENGIFLRTNDAYMAVLRIIDNVNSTQVWAKSRSDFYRIYNFIINNEESFYKRLKEGDTTLVDSILNASQKDLLSFASKICKYLNVWMFNDDAFYIYDYYVVNSLPYYLDYYKVLIVK